MLKFVYFKHSLNIAIHCQSPMGLKILHSELFYYFKNYSVMFERVFEPELLLTLLHSKKRFFPIYSLKHEIYIY